MAHKQDNILRTSFLNDMADGMSELNSSLAVDKVLYEEDIAGSLAHVAMLAAQGIITKLDAQKIAEGLKQIKEEIENGDFKWRDDLEDIHINIENRLHELIGATAGKLHTARSRNDQVMTDSKLWLRKKITATIGQVKNLRRVLFDLASNHVDTIMPGYTHLQMAQVISLAHYFLAYDEMFSRDQKRFENTLSLHDDCPLGSGALAGTSFNIDRAMTARALGFARPSNNSLDAVSSRDFFMNFLADAAIHAVHLSRMAEEMVLWASPHFGYITIADEWSSTSSIMPQKKNPDAAELVRGKSARVIACFNQLAIVMKALPLAYAKDMQEDKECLFAGARAITLMQQAVHGMLSTITINKEAMKKMANIGFATATDLADKLVQEKNMDFRTAYQLTARVVKRAIALGCDLCNMPGDELQAIDSNLSPAMVKNLTPDNSLAMKQSFGSTGKQSILQQLARIKKEMHYE
ncbi:MAG: argininosuccinate lyase [Hydrotalea sp.]|nr:argininosuccinate lyase [Hydrotalea sp.]